MDLKPLQTHLSRVLPILDANLSAAYREYMDGKIPAGAYHYVLARHGDVLTVINDSTMPAEIAYRACAAVAIDLRSGIADLADKSAAQALADGWWQCYRDAGFIEINPYLNIPKHPEPMRAVSPAVTKAEADTTLRGDLPKGAFVTVIQPQPGKAREEGVPEIEVHENCRRGSKLLSVSLTLEKLRLLSHHGIARFESSSGQDPNLHYQYDHYVIN
jgi:hypothetical protein